MFFEHHFLIPFFKLSGAENVLNSHEADENTGLCPSNILEKRKEHSCSKSAQNTAQIIGQWPANLANHIFNRFGCRYKMLTHWYFQFTLQSPHQLMS
jgi:hypothetical protein